MHSNQSVVAQKCVFTSSCTESETSAQHRRWLLFLNVEKVQRQNEAVRANMEKHQLKEMNLSSLSIVIESLRRQAAPKRGQVK